MAKEWSELESSLALEEVPEGCPLVGLALSDRVMEMTARWSEALRKARENRLKASDDLRRLTAELKVLHAKAISLGVLPRLR